MHVQLRESNFLEMKRVSCRDSVGHSVLPGVILMMAILQPMGAQPTAPFRLSVNESVLHRSVPARQHSASRLDLSSKYSSLLQ